MPHRVRVATYNLYLGADLGLLLGDVSADQLVELTAEVLRQLEVTAFPGRAEAVARLIVRERIDLVGLQEVCTWHSDDRLMWDCAEELLAALAALGEPYDVVVSQLSFGGSGTVEKGGRPVTMRLEGRNMILRRRGSAVTVQDTSWGLFDERLSTRLLDAVDVTIGRGWCAARCVVEGAETPFTFVDTHTEAYAPAARDSQRTELVEALPADPRLVLVGDFNAVPDQVGMPPELRDAWLEAGNADDGSGATCCQGGDLRDERSRLAERIDYVWVRGLEVQECTRFGAELQDRTESGLWPSDHAGVAATVLVG